MTSFITSIFSSCSSYNPDKSDGSAMQKGMKKLTGNYKVCLFTRRESDRISARQQDGLVNLRNKTEAQFCLSGVRE